MHVFWCTKQKGERDNHSKKGAIKIAIIMKDIVKTERTEWNNEQSKIIWQKPHRTTCPP